MAGSFNHRWRHVLEAPEPAIRVGSHYSWWDRTCRFPKCHNPVFAEVIYDYVTGRRGRVTSRERMVCAGHLQGWLNRNEEARQLAPRAYYP